MANRWVANASPLIVLGKIGYLDLLAKLADDLVIPAGVASEIGRGPDGDAAKTWLAAAGARYVNDMSFTEPVVAAWDLHDGESQVLAFAYRNRGFEAVVDDRAARRCAHALAIPCRGTLSILLVAKRRGFVSQVGPLLERIQDSGFRVDPATKRSVLDLAGE